MRSSLYFYSFIIFYGIVSSSAFAMDSKDTIRKALQSAVEDYTDQQNKSSCKVAWHEQAAKDASDNEFGLIQTGAYWRHHKNIKTGGEVSTCQLGGIYIADPPSAKGENWKTHVVQLPQVSYDDITYEFMGSQLELVRKNQLQEAKSLSIKSLLLNSITKERYDSVHRGPGTISEGALVAAAKQGTIEIHNNMQCIRSVFLEHQGLNIADMIFLADPNSLNERRLFALGEIAKVGLAPTFKSTITYREVCSIPVDNCDADLSYSPLSTTDMYDPMKIVDRDGVKNSHVSLVEYKTNGAEEREYLYDSNGRKNISGPLQFEMLGKQYSLAQLRHFPVLHTRMLEGYKTPSTALLTIGDRYHKTVALFIEELVKEILDPEKRKVPQDAEKFVYDDKLKVVWTEKRLSQACAITDEVPYYQPFLSDNKNTIDLRKHLVTLQDEMQMFPVMYNGSQLKLDNKSVLVTPLGSLFYSSGSIFKKQNRFLHGEATMDIIFKTVDRSIRRIEAIHSIFRPFQSTAFKHGPLMGVTHALGPKKFFSIFNMKPNNSDDPVPIDITDNGEVNSFGTDKSNNTVACLCTKKTRRTDQQSIVLADLNVVNAEPLTIPVRDERAIRLHSVSSINASYYVRPKGILNMLKYLVYPMIRSVGPVINHDTRNIFDIRDIPGRICDLWKMMRGHL